MQKIHFAVIDTETASLNGGVCELAIVKISEDFEILDEYCKRINPIRKIEAAASEVHGIFDEDVANCPTLAEEIQNLDTPLVIAHNAQFDLRMLAHAYVPKAKLCTLQLSKATFKGLPNYKLGTVASHCGYGEFNAHSALDDALACLHILKTVCKERNTGLVDLFVEFNKGLKK